MSNKFAEDTQQPGLQCVEDPHKRRLVFGLSALMGLSTASELLGGKALSVAMAYEADDGLTKRKGKIFSSQEMATLKEVCQTVIPKTETAGAGDVDVHGFIDNQLFHCFGTREQKQIGKLLRDIDSVAEETDKMLFVDLPSDKKLSLLDRLDRGVLPFSSSQKAVFRSLKPLIVFGYYTSEVGATKELTYLAFPGEYKGSIPYKSVGSAWGSIAFL